MQKSGLVGSIGENKSREGLGGVGVGKVLEGLAHNFAQEGIGVNLADGLGKVGGRAVLVNAEGAAAGDEGLRVEALVIIGALNWGAIGLFGFDLVAFICGGQMAVLSRVIYTVVGIAGLWCVSLLFRESVTGEATA